MRKNAVVGAVVFSLVVFGGFALLLATQEAGDGFARFRGGPTAVGGVVSVTVTDDAGIPITSIARGNVVRVNATHEAVDPMSAVATLLIPVTDPGTYGRPTKTHWRVFRGSSTGETFTFHIPDFIQVDGTARVRVQVQGIGIGSASFTVTP